MGTWRSVRRVSLVATLAITLLSGETSGSHMGDKRLNTLVGYAKSMIGRPYVWGGDNPVVGFDCSGLVQEILKSVDEAPPTDTTAQGIYDFLISNGGKKGIIGEGAIAFYGKDLSHITHVAFMVDHFRIVEAGGGGSSITSEEAAGKKNAFVRIRVVTHRKDFLGVVMPRYNNLEA